MRLYVTGATVLELEEIEKVCRRRGWEFRPLQGRMGRSPVHVDVAELVNAFERTGSVRGSARELGLNPGTAWFRLRDAGALSNGPGGHNGD